MFAHLKIRILLQSSHQVLQLNRIDWTQYVFEKADSTYAPKEYAEINRIKFTIWLTIFAKDKDQTKPVIETG
jgi:hypothetical protein